MGCFRKKGKEYVVFFKEVGRANPYWKIGEKIGYVKEFLDEVSIMGVKQPLISHPGLKDAGLKYPDVWLIEGKPLYIGFGERGGFIP